MKKFIFNIFSLIILLLGIFASGSNTNFYSQNNNNYFKKYNNNQTDINQLLIGLDQSFYFDPINKIVYENNYDLTLQTSSDNSNNWVEKEINQEFYSLKKINKNASSITYDVAFEMNAWNNWNTSFYLQMDDNLFITYFTDYSYYDYSYFVLPQEVNGTEIVDFGYINNQFIILFSNGDIIYNQILYQYDQDNNLYLDFSYLNAGKMIDFAMTDNYLFATTDQGAIYQYGTDIFDINKDQDILDQPLIIYSYDIDQSYYYLYNSSNATEDNILGQSKNVSPINGPALKIYLESSNGTSDHNHLIIQTDRNFYQIYYFQNYLFTFDKFFADDNYDVSFYSIKENHFNTTDVYVTNTLNPDNNLYITNIDDFSESSLEVIDFNLLTEIEETSIEGYTSPIYQKEIINFAETELPDVYLVTTNDNLQYLIKLIITDGKITYYQVTTYNWIDKMEDTNFSGKGEIVTQNPNSLEFKLNDIKINTDRSLNEMDLELEINNVLITNSSYDLNFEGINKNENDNLSYYFEINLSSESSNSLIEFNNISIYSQNNQIIEQDVNYMTYTTMSSPVIKQNDNFEIIENDEDDTDTSFYFTVSFLTTGDYNFESDEIMTLNATEQIDDKSREVSLDATYVKLIEGTFSSLNQTYEYEVQNLDEEAIYNNFSLTISQPNVIGLEQTESFEVDTTASFIAGNISSFPIFAYVLLLVFLLLFIAILAFYYLNYVYNKRSAEKIEYTFENWDNLSDSEISKIDKTIKTEEYSPKTIHKKVTKNQYKNSDQQKNKNN